MGSEMCIRDSMLSGQQHEYVTWLSNLDRRIALKLGKAEE